jgi:predicted nucleotidyltransferase component of viral defense system
MALRPFGVRVAAAVRATGAPHEVVLRDHALSYMLAAIYADAELGDVMAFKGGTALRKCFFPGYRFSEDLDFTMRERWDEARIEGALHDAAAEAARLTASHGVFRFVVDRREHRGLHPFGQLDLRVTVDYPTGARLAIKVEITRDEPLVLPTTWLNLIHLFDGEALAADIQCYSLEEIAVEKLRAFLQARENLERREWLNRVRDLYDIGYLWGQDSVHIDWAALRGPLEVKARARGVEFSGPADFRDERVLEVYRAQWEPRLRGFVPALPTFEEAVTSLDEVLAAVFG